MTSSKCWGVIALIVSVLFAPAAVAQIEGDACQAFRDFESAHYTSPQKEVEEVVELMFAHLPTRQDSVSLENFRAWIKPARECELSDYAFIPYLARLSERRGHYTEAEIWWNIMAWAVVDDLILDSYVYADDWVNLYDRFVEMGLQRHAARAAMNGVRERADMFRNYACLNEFDRERSPVAELASVISWSQKVGYDADVVLAYIRVNFEWRKIHRGWCTAEEFQQIAHLLNYQGEVPPAWSVQ